MKCSDIINTMEQWAPLELCESWDNSGLLLGDFDAEIDNVLISLDFTEKTASEATANGCQLIITHHPFIFSKINKINTSGTVGKLIIKAAKAGLCIYSAHTNLDYAPGGTSDMLFDTLGLVNKQDFMPKNNLGASLGRFGELKELCSMSNFVGMVKDKLRLTDIKYTGNPEDIVKTVALIAGSGGDSEYLQRAVSMGADVYVSGDIKYHAALDCVALGLPVIDATHYATEIMICDKIKEVLDSEINRDANKVNIYVSEISNQPFHVQ